MQLSHLVALYATISSCPQCSATRLREIARAVPGPRHHFLTAGIGWHHSWRLVGVLGQHLSRGIGRIRRQSADLPAHASRASTELDESRLNHLSTNGAAMPRAAGSAWSTCGQCSSWPGVHGAQKPGNMEPLLGDVTKATTLKSGSHPLDRTHCTAARERSPESKRLDSSSLNLRRICEFP